MAAAKPNSGESPQMTRGARRRHDTRTRLIEAARTLFAKQGVDATRINEITELADVGFGSFYNHFAEKDDIVSAVVQETAEAHGAALDALTDSVEDPAEVVSIAHRHFIRLARADETWGWLAVRLEITHRVLSSALGARAHRDVVSGVESGRFDVPDVELALSATGGALIGVMRTVLDGYADERADELHAEMVLRMLGLGHDEAREVASRPLPEGEASAGI